MKTRAITLTETILVILIIGIIMACLAPYLKGIQDFWIFTDRQTAILQGARDAMNKMIKTLKAAHSITDIDPRGRGTYLALTNYLDQPIVYFHNIESSPYYIGNTGNIKIGDLVMQTKDPSNNTVNSLLCQSVDSITFTYIKPSMDRTDPATQPNQVQAVRILFYAKDPDQTTDIKLPMSCLAYLMNVKAVRGGGTWARTFGGIKSDEAYSVQQTSDGGYIIIGNTDAMGVPDIYVIKINKFGQEEWSKTFGGSSYDSGGNVQQTPDGGYAIIGSTRSFGAGYYDFYLVKTNFLGQEEWSKTFGSSGSSEIVNSAKQTTDGGYIMAGYTMPHLSPDYDVYLVKTNKFGQKEWSKIVGGVTSHYAMALSVQQTIDGGYIIAGRACPTGTLNHEAYLVKTNFLGQEEWSKTFGGTGTDMATSVQQTPDGGYIIAGSGRSRVEGGEEYYDAWLIKTNASGEEEWSKTFGGTKEDGAFSVQQTTDGGYIIAGRTGSFGAGNYDFYLIKTDSQGNCPEASNPEGP